jgi:cytidylate kinase
MRPRIDSGIGKLSIVLCGPLCAGKTTLAAGLSGRGLTQVTAIDAIEAQAGRSGLSRAELQRIGRELEASSPGRWLAEAAARATLPVVLDAARTADQVGAARHLLGGVVVHLTASPDTRRDRFERRRPVRRSDAVACFDDLAASPLELGAEKMGAIADLAIDTENLTVEETLEAVLARLSALR